MTGRHDPADDGLAPDHPIREKGRNDLRHSGPWTSPWNSGSLGGMSGTSAPPARFVRAEAAAGPAADLLERVRPDLRMLALEDVLRDGSGRARAADAVLATLIDALRAGDDAVLAALRKAAEQHAPARKRPHEVEDLLDVVRHAVRAPSTQECLRVGKFPVAGAAVSSIFIDAVIGVGDLFEQLRKELPDLEALENARADVAIAATRHLASWEEHELWYEGILRAMLRATGVSTKDAEGMTDFIRKRAKPREDDSQSSP